PVDADKREGIAFVEVVLSQKVQATIHGSNDMAGIAGGGIAECDEGLSAPDSQSIPGSPNIQPTSGRRRSQADIAIAFKKDRVSEIGGCREFGDPTCRARHGLRAYLLCPNREPNPRRNQ